MEIAGATGSVPDGNQQTAYFAIDRWLQHVQVLGKASDP
jgi:hypothetical protein